MSSRVEKNARKRKQHNAKIEEEEQHDDVLK